MSKDLLRRLRAICLALPEATEKQAWGAPTFRVRDRLFAMYVHDHHGDWPHRAVVQRAAGRPEAPDPRRSRPLFVLPYVGHRGWIGVNLDKVRDWAAVAELVRDGYRLVAPKMLVRMLDERRDRE